MPPIDPRGSRLHLADADRSRGGPMFTASACQNLNPGQDTRAEPKREGHRNQTERSEGQGAGAHRVRLTCHDGTATLVHALRGRSGPTPALGPQPRRPRARGASVRRPRPRLPERRCPVAGELGERRFKFRLRSYETFASHADFCSFFALSFSSSKEAKRVGRLFSPCC